MTNYLDSYLKNPQRIAELYRLAGVTRLEQDTDSDFLAALRRQQAIVETALDVAILEARQKGVSWTDIASGLQVTRQAAQQRYAKLVD